MYDFQPSAHLSLGRGKSYFYYSNKYSQFGNLILDIQLGTFYIISVHVLSKKNLVDYYNKHKETKSQLEAWYHETKNAEWKNPQEIKEKYASASIIGGNRVVFNIKGNKYRLVTIINYQMKIVYIRFIGTHKEYDKINAEEI
jgi:mRNA interferase HigB